MPMPLIQEQRLQVFSAAAVGGIVTGRIPGLAAPAARVFFDRVSDQDPQRVDVFPGAHTTAGDAPADQLRGM